MRAALRFHAVELAITVPRGAMEAALLRRYSLHLGVVRDPDVEVVLHPAEPGASLVRGLDLRGGAPHIEADVEADDRITDGLLGSLVGPALVRQGCLLVRASLVEDEEVEVHLGQAIERGASWHGLLLLHRSGGRWRATTTALGEDAERPTRRATPDRIRVGTDEPEAALLAATALGSASPACRAAARDLARSIARDVPCVVGPAGGPVGAPPLHR